MKDAITRHHRYTTPLGSVGVTVVDLVDVAEVAALELLRRERSAAPLPTEVIEVVGPEAHTGQSIVRLWSDVLGENVSYEGDDLDAVEQRMRGVMPAAGAYDLKLVFRGILREGVLSAPAPPSDSSRCSTARCERIARSPSRWPACPPSRAVRSSSVHDRFDSRAR